MSGAIAAAAASSSSTEHLEGEGEGEKPHVLVVDDSHVDRLLVANLLRRSSCTVSSVEDGVKALEYLGVMVGQGDDDSAAKSRRRRRRVDLVLSDYCMPRMTGCDLLKKIKESSHTKEVPVVIMSSEGTPSIINQCLEEGAEMFIHKPLKLSDVQKIRRQVMHMYMQS